MASERTLTQPPVLPLSPPGNLTALLLPGFHHAMGEEVKQLMRSLVELTELGDNDDYYDDDDDEDAELVDGSI